MTIQSKSLACNLLPGQRICRADSYRPVNVFIVRSVETVDNGRFPIKVNYARVETHAPGRKPSKTNDKGAVYFAANQSVYVLGDGQTIAQLMNE